MVDEADKTKLIDALHEDARYPTGDKTFKEHDVATWTEANLRPLPMEKLVELEAHCTKEYTSPLRMPVYVVPLIRSEDAAASNGKKGGRVKGRLDMPDWTMNPMFKYIFPTDKSEVLMGSRDITRLSMSREVFDRDNAMNTRTQLSEIEGMIIVRNAHQGRVDRAKAELERIKELPEKARSDEQQLEAANNKVKEEEEMLKHARAMRKSRRNTRTTSFSTQLELEEKEARDIDIGGDFYEDSVRQPHYSIRASPISAVTIPPEARKVAKVPEKASFFCYSFPMLPGYRAPAGLDPSTSGSSACLASLSPPPR